MSYAVFEKTMEYMRKYSDLKLVTTYLVSEPNYNMTKNFAATFFMIQQK